jgi:hypothetical protein
MYPVTRQSQRRRLLVTFANACVVLLAGLVVVPGTAQAAAKNRTVKLGDGASLVVAPGASVKLLRPPRSVGALPRGEVGLGAAVKLQFRGGRRGRVATMRFGLPAESQDMSASAAKAVYRIRVWNGRKGWRAIPARVNEKRTVISAAIRRRGARARSSAALPFLVTGGPAVFRPTAVDLDQTLQSVLQPLELRSRERPECPADQPPPKWAQANLTTELNAPLLGCLRGEGDVAIAELVNNRPYGVIVRYGTPVTFGWADHGFGLPKLHNALLIGAPDGLYIPALRRASIGVPRNFTGSAKFTAKPSPATVALDALIDLDELEVEAILLLATKSKCRAALGSLLAKDLGFGSVGEVTASLTAALTKGLDCIPEAVDLINRKSAVPESRKHIRRVYGYIAASPARGIFAGMMAVKYGNAFIDAAGGGLWSEFQIHEGGAGGGGDTPGPKPTASNLTASDLGGGNVSVAFDVGWQAGRDPVTCHFFQDGTEVFSAQCGTRSSKTLSGVAAGSHTYHATVSDKFGVYSNPSNSVTVNVGGGSSPPPDPEPKPTASNLQVVVYGGGHVGMSFNVGWQAGRDPVTCHFFRDGVEVFTAQCGTSSSKQFYGVPAGTHSFYATVSDKFGVYSDPTPTVTKTTT